MKCGAQIRKTWASSCQKQTLLHFINITGKVDSPLLQWMRIKIADFSWINLELNHSIQIDYQWDIYKQGACKKWGGTHSLSPSPTIFSFHSLKALFLHTSFVPSPPTSRPTIMCHSFSAFPALPTLTASTQEKLQHNSVYGTHNGAPHKGAEGAPQFSLHPPFHTISSSGKPPCPHLSLLPSLLPI